MNPVLSVENLRKVYRTPGPDGSPVEHVAVNDVSFTLHQGGSLAVVGESGAGKSTIARVVAGIEVPTAGIVRIDEDPYDAPRITRAERKRRARLVQMVFQDPYSSLNPRQTIAAGIDEAMHQHFDWDAHKRRTRVDELLDQVGLQHKHRDVYPRQLSGGQRQRVAIARALSVQPRLLILDEAVSALDVSVQAQILNLLGSLRRSTDLDVAFLFISHDLAVVRQVSDDVIVMRHGTVVEHGETEQVLDRPAADYTRRLLSAMPRPGWKPRRRNPHGVDSPLPKSV